MVHLKTEDILAYVTNRMTDEKSSELEIHLAKCDECVKRVRIYHIIGENFDELWDTWTAKKHAEEYWQARLSEALTSASVPERLKQRVKKWLDNVSQGADFAVGVIIDTSKKVANVVEEGLESLCPRERMPQFLQVPIPSRVTGSGLPVKEGTKFFEAQGPPWAEIIIEPSVTKITIQREITKQPWPLVLLLPQKGGKAFVNEFRHPEETDFLLAEFENLASGAYILVTEPATSHEKGKKNTLPH